MHKTLTLAILLMLAAPAAANRLMPANQAAQIAGSQLSVTPSRDWNRLTARPGRSAETWTLDGDALNDLTFYSGIENDRPIFREVSRRDRPLPRFSSTMLLTDIPTLLENSYRVGREVSVFSVDAVEPTRFAGQSGVLFRYSFTAPDEVRRRGEAYGAIFGGKLFLVTFEAPAIHYFESTVEDFRRLIGTATLR